MSASCRSDRRLRPSRAVSLAAVLAAAILIVATAGARVRSGAVVDSGENVRRISISPRGIVIVRDGGTDSLRDEIRDGIRTGIRDGIRDHIRTRIVRRANGRLVEIDEGGTGMVRIWSDAFVPKGQRVDGDVVAVCGSATIEGEVTGDVVAVLGSVHLRPGARVKGDAVSIGGPLDQADSVTVGGETVSLGFSPFTWGLPALPVMLIAIGCGWLVSMFVGWIFVLLFPSGMLRVATVVERRPAASFFLGMLSVPMFFVALALLFVTVIGIPLGIMLPMLYVLIGYAGQIAATSVLGARLARRSLSQGLLMPLFVGTAFVAVLLAAGAVLSVNNGFGNPVALLFTVSGIVLLLVLGALGTGAFLLSRFGTRPRDVVWTGHLATGPMPAPAPPLASS